MTDEPKWLSEAARAAESAWEAWSTFQDIVRAALPIIEAGLREQIACEIEAHQRGSALRVGDVWEQGRDSAARIARGQT